MEVGSVYKTNLGGDLEVTEYQGSNNVTVRFLDVYGFTTKATKQAILGGFVKNPYAPRLFGVGYLGEGPYLKINGKSNTKEYDRWSNMLERCYSLTRKELNPSYLLCSSVEDWHNFQVFAEWNYHQKGSSLEDWQLDKDLIVKGNKIYSPETCCFLPREVNRILVKQTASKDDGLPTGVCSRRGDKSFFSVSLDTSGNTVRIYTKDPVEAFIWYKDKKESLILQLASKWKDSLDVRAYEALLNYQVEY